MFAIFSISSVEICPHESPTPMNLTRLLFFVVVFVLINNHIGKSQATHREETFEVQVRLLDGHFKEVANHFTLQINSFCLFSIKIVLVEIKCCIIKFLKKKKKHFWEIFASVFNFFINLTSSLGHDKI